MQRAVLAALGSRRWPSASCLLLLPRDGDHAIAGGGELAGDAEAEAAAAAGDDDVATVISHSAAPACRSRRPSSAGTNADRGRHLVARQRVAAELQDLALDARCSPPARAQSAFSTTSATTIAPVIGLLLRPHQRHAHLRMPVDHRLDLLGMNLQAADIDDAAAAADEVVAVAAQLHHVAGVDEAVGVARAPRVARRDSAAPCAASGCAASRRRPSSRRRRGAVRA